MVRCVADRFPGLTDVFLDHGLYIAAGASAAAAERSRAQDWVNESPKSDEQHMQCSTPSEDTQEENGSDDRSLYAIGTYCHNLEVLSVESKHMVWLGVGDEALEAIGSSCSALENLSLDNLNKCSDRLNNGFFFMSIIFQRNLVIDLPMVHMYGVGLGVQSPPACDVCQDRLLQNTAYKYWTADIIGQSVASLNVTSGRSWTYNLWMARSGSARRRLPWTPKYCEHYMPVRSGIISIVMVLLVEFLFLRIIFHCMSSLFQAAR
uniref:Uncharacterized protein n=1 Tax=Oryza glumipatula TaxID=40148 RepID=A0A0E0AV29_9ORYZ